jgi:hypothetical protein
VSDTPLVGGRLVRAQRSLFLTEEQGSHLEATEWSTKIRRFLRSNGWLPEDERHDPS